MSKTIVIGGGLSGLSTGIYLAESGIESEIIESSPKLGGRTYSFQDKRNSTEIDNGQHIMMGAYDETIKFLEMIGSAHLPKHQKNLKVEFLIRGGKKYILSAPNIPYPLNLLIALFQYEAFNFNEKISLFRLFGLLFLNLDKNTEENSVKEWLEENGQSKNVIKSFWEIICVGTLNINISNASSKIFKSLIKRIFFKGNAASTIILPSASLNKLFINPATEYLSKSNTKIFLSEKLFSISHDGKKVNKLVTNKREITNFDDVVLAIPPYAISKIDNYEKILKNSIAEMDTSSIITIHIWIDNFGLNEKFIGFINSDIHWIFDNSDHFSIVISAADEMVNLDNEEIFKKIIKELNEFFPDTNFDNIKSYRVLKEKRATIRSDIKNEHLRVGIESKYSNLHFAGDWTNTGLPGTIEGAILSGRETAQKIINKNN